MVFADSRTRRRKPSLTPMIDVVFLLLVFFMLASRFGIDQVLPMPLASGGGDFTGKPRLVDVLPDGLRLNGIAISEADLGSGLAELMDEKSDAIILRSSDGATVQRVIATSELLRAAGFKAIVLVE
ncbi:biopolymer transporter ExbD [Shimia sp. R10_1]|uniref:ExbD/TolR family protein n=1 Tax=Shimia sp. R10_1 TaxID=2821095 RepID=UPI001ADC3A7D|nr:biopolymer transporter ExbD [Shimia sp. R10_1]MBO9474840.1 biopolymer transporter ExbD [Shimia sp. R10_1]